MPTETDTGKLKKITEMGLEVVYKSRIRLQSNPMQK